MLGTKRKIAEQFHRGRGLYGGFKKRKERVGDANHYRGYEKVHGLRHGTRKEERGRRLEDSLPIKDWNV